MGLVIANKEAVQQYFDSPRRSQSFLKKLLGGLDDFLEKEQKTDTLYYEEKDSFIIGQAVDTILLHEDGIFEENFHISNLTDKPGDKLISIIQMIFDVTVANHENFKETILDISLAETILEAARHHDYYPKWKDDTLINSIIKNGAAYYEELKNSYGKQILSLEENLKIQKIVESLKSNERTSYLFDRETLAQEEYVTTYYQYPIYFTVGDEECKALLDILRVYTNSSGDVIKVEPIDLKTTAFHTVDFLTSLKKFRYDIQGALYGFACRTLWPDFEAVYIENFKFVVETTKNYARPLIFQMSPELTIIGTTGNFEDTETRFKIKGFMQLLEDYKYFESTGYQEEKFITDNNGVLELDWYGINNK